MHLKTFPDVNVLELRLERILADVTKGLPDGHACKTSAILPIFLPRLARDDESGLDLEEIISVHQETAVGKSGVINNTADEMAKRESSKTRKRLSHGQIEPQTKNEAEESAGSNALLLHLQDLTKRRRYAPSELT